MTFAEYVASPPVFITMGAVFGLAIGSFLNVVIHRLPKMMEREWQAQCAELRGETPPVAPRFDLVTPRSGCPSCGHRITPLENIPLASYLWLRGRCSACKASIGIRYPVVEALTGIATAYCAWRFGFGYAAFGAMLFTWCMIALAVIDIDTQLLPDSITLPLVWAGLLFNLRGTFVDLQSAVIGAVAGYLVLWTVYWAFKFATGKEGMGFGDFKLLAAIGAWLGWKMLPLVILASSFVGAVAGVALMILARRGRDVPIPFGPYLAGAGLIALFWGQGIVDRYLAQLL
ncbi:MAG: A24 family peptidase [Burkholderiales bacterium]|jgi:leader peptidase (prepilin peptidase) / N-methyltransferase